VTRRARCFESEPLKVTLVIVGLLFCAAAYPLILMVKEDPALAMMMSLSATLGIFLLLASRNPRSRLVLAGTSSRTPVKAHEVMADRLKDHAQRQLDTIEPVPNHCVGNVRGMPVKDACPGGLFFWPSTVLRRAHGSES
jgi:hypothetical protein